MFYSLIALSYCFIIEALKQKEKMEHSDHEETTIDEDADDVVANSSTHENYYDDEETQLPDEDSKRSARGTLGACSMIPFFVKYLF